MRVPVPGELLPAEALGRVHFVGIGGAGLSGIARIMLARGLTVMIETGGHRSIARVPADVLKIVDVKCPGSGEAHRNHWENLAAVGSRDEVKFVIKDREDYEYARDVVARYGLAGKAGAILFSPVHGVLDARVLSEWVLSDRLPVRLQLQLHKFIWSPETRGV